MSSTEPPVKTWLALAMRAKVSPTTIENWIYGRTTPRGNELGKVALALHPHTTKADLERAYFDLPPESPPLIDALRDLVPELHELVTLLRAQADQEVLEAVRDALAARRRGSLRRALGEPDEPSSEGDDRE